jgi:ABC-2 type transport system permease protein
MASRALGGAVQSLYTRGDLDLLLASPVDRRAIIGVRMGSLAAMVAGEVALLVWPFANVFVLFGHFGWLRAYLLVPAMAMLATSVGLGVALVSFRTIGPRRTRVAMQVLAALVGMGMMLAIYMPQIMQPEGRPGGLPASAMALARHSGSFGEMLVVPARILLNGAMPTLVFALACTALIVATIQLAGEPIVRTLTGISGGGQRGRRSADDVVRFHGSFRVVVVLKELKLIARDPFLITQILQQNLMLLPMTFLLWRSHLGDLPLVWLAVIWLAAGIAGPLAWLTIQAEDAPDLLAAAPMSRAALVRVKLEAALLPALPVCAVPLFFLLATRPWYAICTSACAFGAALTHAALNMRNPVALRRDSFRKRHQGNFANVLLELLSLAFWLLACVGLAWLGTLIGWR